MLFVNLVMSNITLSLMLSNMAGKKFTAIQPIIGMLIVPPAAYHLLGCSDKHEILLTNYLTMTAFLIWLGRMFILALQWRDVSHTSIFITPKEKRE